ncbi:MAG: AAA family ATPase [Candidatus Tenebribacter mawsonii]|nr:AAA family ATPase [Candidatus Tenebribacter mawsonii]
MNTIDGHIDEKPGLVKKTEDHTTTEKKETFLSKYANLRITSEINIPEPYPIISINGNIISTAGNLTMLSGSSKAGKSAFCSVILAGVIRGHDDGYDGFEPLYIDGNKQKKAVIHIDTEQAKHDHFKNMIHAIIKRSRIEKSPEYFYSYNIRGMELEDMQEWTRDLFTEVAKSSNGIHIAVIDSIADYISSVNKEEQANSIVHFFETLAIEYDCPIIAILHLNPNSNKERGHLGSQLQRKAESVLQIKKSEDGISYCEPYLLRNANSMDVPILQFEYDSDKKYHTYAGIKDRKDEQNDKPAIFKEIAKEVFSDKPINHKDAVSKIILFTGMSEATAKRYIKRMSEEYNFIKIVEVKDQSGREKFYVSLLG